MYFLLGINYTFSPFRKTCVHKINMAFQVNLSVSETLISDEPSQKYLNDARVYISKLCKDMTIISGEDEEIHANKHLLELFTSSISPLFSDQDNPTKLLYLPNCSSASIKFLLNVITTFALLENLDPKQKPTCDDIQEKVELACEDDKTIKKSDESIMENDETIMEK